MTDHRNEWAEREKAWDQRHRPGGIEEQYQNWCREHGFDPESTEAMSTYG